MCMLYGPPDTEVMRDIAVVYRTEVEVFWLHAPQSNFPRCERGPVFSSPPYIPDLGKGHAGINKVLRDTI